MEKGHIKLTEKQLTILKYLLENSQGMEIFIVNKSQSELARELGITRQALNVHLRKLRE